jgi:hypothetical protein
MSELQIGLVAEGDTDQSEIRSRVPEPRARRHDPLG